MITMDGLSQEEIEEIQAISRRYEADIDPRLVASIIESDEFSPVNLHQDFMGDPSIWEDISPAEWAAYSITLRRGRAEVASEGGKQVASQWWSSLASSHFVIEAAAGLQVIKDLEEFWRFKPTLELLFEMNQDSFEKISEFVQAFEGSDHANAMNRNKREMTPKFKEWLELEHSTEKIRLGLDIYEDCFKILEKGFTVLLALKRVKDGDAPDVDSLQEIPATNVRIELTDEESEPNSVFFDLIVNIFNSSLRNGIAHNDIVIDPPIEEVRIPIENTSFDYDEFADILISNVANSVFVTGTFQKIVKWRSIAFGEDIHHKRPDWVFGERSISEEYIESVDTELSSGHSK